VVFRHIAAVAAAVLVAGCSGPHSDSTESSRRPLNFAPVTVTDCAGKNPVTFDSPPVHIVASNNSAADLLARIGAGSQVLGLGWARGLDALPPGVRGELRNVKRFSDGDIDKETLLTAGGDMYLTTFAGMEMMGTAEPSKADFDAAGLRTVYVKSSACALSSARRDLDSVFDDIRTISTLTGHASNGVDVVSHMRAQIAHAQASIPAGTAEPTVFHMDVAASGDSLMTPGNRQIANAIYTLAKVRPLGGSVDSSFTRFSYEQLVAADPDWITVAVRRTGDDAAITRAQDTAISALKADPRTERLRAVIGNRFLRATSEDMTLAGPQNADQVAYIVDAVYGS
jgi:iron complex transport system substrate-binding protein